MLGQAIFGVLFVVFRECLCYIVRNGTGEAGCGVILCMHFAIYDLQVLVMCPAPFGTFYSAVRIYSFVSPCFDIGIVIYERMVYGYVTIYVANLDVV